MKKDTQSTEKQSNYKYNVVRNKKLTYLKRKNMEMAKQLQQYTNTAKMDENSRVLADTLIKSLRACGGMSLYSYDGAKIELISFLGCNHRICNICNWDRQKKIRRKYLRWFDGNPALFVLNGKDGKGQKVVTAAQRQKWLSKGYTEAGQVRYNIMHLMLSVPHTENGWRGSRFYFRELAKQFNFLRKKTEWLYWVYGGQFGLETTKNANGYHIHIHALLFVRNERQNRNKLHKVILYWWNHLTIDENNKRGKFTEEEVTAIMRGNRTFSFDFVNTLDPRGATIIHLQNIFVCKTTDDGYSLKENIVINDYDPKGGYLSIIHSKSYEKTDNCEKVKKHIDINDWKTEDFIGAVLETISYLFKPKVFAIGDQYFDCESIIELLPYVHNNRSLYSKFGCLMGEKTLNVHDDTLLEDMTEAADLKGEEGESCAKEFFITNPNNTYSTDKQIRLKRHNTGTVTIPASCTSEAVKILYESSFQRR